MLAHVRPATSRRARRCAIATRRSTSLPRALREQVRRGTRAAHSRAGARRAAARRACGPHLLLTRRVERRRLVRNVGVGQVVEESVRAEDDRVAWLDGYLSQLRRPRRGGDEGSRSGVRQRVGATPRYAPTAAAMCCTCAPAVPVRAARACGGGRSTVITSTNSRSSHGGGGSNTATTCKQPQHPAGSSTA